MLKVGKHCDFCKQNDFLPFQCRKCQKLCCSDHREKHPCIAEEKNQPIPERNPTPKEKKVYKQPIALKQPAPAPTKTPEKLSALEKLKAYMASRPQRSYKAPARAEAEAKAKAESAKKDSPSAIGDDTIPAASRHFMHIRRPQQQVKDAITGHLVTRPEKKVLVFYDKSKPIGYALDRARKTLGLGSATSFQLNGSPLPSSSPIGAIPPNSTLDLV